MKKLLFGMLIEFIKAQDVKVRIKDTDGDGNPELIVSVNDEELLNWEIELPVGEGVKALVGSILKGKKGK